MTNMYHTSTLKFLILSALMLCIYAQTRQIFNPTIETKLRFSYNFSDPNTILGAIMATTDQRSNNTFYFDPTNTARAPRILSTVKVTPDNSTYGGATIPPQTLSQPETNVSVHYFKMTAANVGAPNYAISGSRYLKTANFPEIGDVFESITTTDIATLSSNTDYLTLIFTSLIYHDTTVDLTCQYTIDYTGFVRSIYFNDDPRGQWGVTEDTITSRQNYTYGPVHLNAAEMVMLTIIGYRLNIISFNIVNCVNPSGVAVTPNLTYYSPGNRITSPQGITYNKQTTTCQTTSERCIDDAYSVACDFNYFRSEDLCRGFCPTTELTVTSYSDCSTFAYSDIRKGYKTAAEQVNSAKATTFSFYVDLQSGSQVLTVFWPSESNIMTPTTLWFPGGSYIMSKAVYSLDTLPDSGVVNYSVPLTLLTNSQSADTVQMQYSHHAVITDPTKTLMAVSYNAEPTTQAEMLAPRSFSYVPHATLLSLNADTFIYVTTFLNCIEACILKVHASGYVEGYQDTRTFLFAMNYGPVAWSYTVPDSVTGLMSVTFRVYNSTAFQLDVLSRNYTIFSHEFPMSMQTLSLSQSAIGVTDATSTACVNGENGVCFSCNAGYYLNEDTGACVATCPAGYVTFKPDRRCFRTECEQYTVAINDNTCIPQCSEDERFYIDGAGCTGECFKGCPVCSNNTGVCIDCAYKDPISFVAQCSHCPPGTTFDNGADACVDNTALALSIMGPAQISSCADLILTASMDPVEELYLSPITFTWTVTSSSGASIVDLQAFLANETRKELIIPSSYLTVNADYTFTVQYSNVFDRVKTATKDVSVVTSALPPIQIDGGGNQAFYHYNDNVLKARVAYSEDCFTLSDPLQAVWTQVGGPGLSLSTDATSPFWLTIPKCTLTPGGNYTFKVSVWRTSDASVVSTETTEFRVPPVNFTVDIVNGNIDFPYNTNIDLTTVLNYKAGDCGYSGAAIKYTWTCQIKTTGTDDINYDVCSDPKGLFNRQSTSSVLRIPTSYFTQDQTLRIGVTATDGTDSTYDSVVLNATSSTTPSISLDCINCDISSYPPYLIFSGTVPNNAITGLSYAWSVSPKLNSTAFNTQYKVTKSSILQNKDLMQVQFTADNNAGSVSGYLQIPVDPAPASGALTVTPDFGESLSTFFHISAAGWQDTDAPLSYEFFYQFHDGPEYRLTDKQRYPYIYTMLPGSATSDQLIIKVVVSDSLGAQGTARTVIQVTSQGDNIMDDLRTFRSNFASITYKGDPSVTTGDSLEMLKALSFMAREMNTFENLNTSYQPGYLTTDEHNEVIGFKIAMIDNINTVHNLIPNQETDEMLIQTISSMTNNTAFNVPSSILLLTETMTSALGAKGVLSSTEMANTGYIISNILANFNSGGYSKANAKELRAFTANWMSKLRSNSLIDRIPDEAPLILTSRNVDAYLTQTTGCSLIATPIKPSDEAVQFNFNVLPGSQNDPLLGCNQVYNLAYFAFNPNKSSLQNASTETLTQKSMIAFAITDSSNNIVTLPLTYVTGDPNYCPEECGRRENGDCRCPDASTFDIDDVLDELFGIEKNIEVWYTVPFWADIIPGGWLLLTLLIVSCLIPRYCKFNGFMQGSFKTRFNAISTAYLMSHPLLSIYTYFDKDLPKTRRAALYFLKVQFLSVMACLLALQSKDKKVGDILLYNWNGSIPAFLLVFLIPYATVYPGMLILSKLLRTYRTKKNVTHDPTAGSQRESETSYGPITDAPYKPKNSKLVFIFGVILSLALLAGSQVYTWYTAVNQTKIAQRNAWATYLAFAMLLDVVITPLIFMALSYIGASILSSKAKNGQKPGFMHRALGSVIDPRMVELKNEPLQKKVAPRPQELMMAKDPSVFQVEGANMDRQVSVGGALPEYYANGGAAGQPEKAVYKANNRLSVTNSQGIPLSRQGSSESMLNRLNSYSKNNDPLILMRNGTSIPSLDRLDSNNPGSKPSLESLAAIDLEDEDRQLIKTRSNGYEPKRPIQIIKGADGSLALRESQISGSMDNVMFKVEGESSKGNSRPGSRQQTLGKGGVRSLNNLEGQGARVAGAQGTTGSLNNLDSRYERLGSGGRGTMTMPVAMELARQVGPGAQPVYDEVTGLYYVQHANDMDIQDYRENPNNLSQFSKISIIPQAVNIQQVGSLNSRFDRDNSFERGRRSVNSQEVIPGKIRSTSKNKVMIPGTNNYANTSMLNASYNAEDLNTSHNVDPRYARESMGGVNSVNPKGRMIMKEGIQRPMGMGGAMNHQDGVAGVDIIYGASAGGNVSAPYNADPRYNNNVNDPELIGRGQQGVNAMMMNNSNVDPRYKVGANGMMVDNYADNVLNPDGTINPAYVNNVDPRYNRRGSVNETPNNRQNRNALNSSREIDPRHIEELRNNGSNPQVYRDFTGMVVPPSVVVGAGATNQYNRNAANGNNSSHIRETPRDATSQIYRDATGMVIPPSVLGTGAADQYNRSIIDGVHKVNGQQVQVQGMRNDTRDANGNVNAQNGSTTGPTDPNFRVPTGYKNSNDPHLLATAAKQTNTSLIRGDNGTRETRNATSGINQAEQSFEKGGVQPRGRTRHVGHNPRQGDQMDNQESFYTMRDTEEFNNTGRNPVFRQGQQALNGAPYARNSMTPRANGDYIPRMSRDNSMDAGHRLPQDLNASVTICAHCRRASLDNSMDLDYRGQSVLQSNINAQPQFARNSSVRSQSVNPYRLQEALSIPVRDGFPEEESMDLAGDIDLSRKPSSTNTGRTLGFGKLSSTNPANFRRPLKTDTVVSIGMTPKQAQEAKKAANNNVTPKAANEDASRRGSLVSDIDPHKQQIIIEREEEKVNNSRDAGVKNFKAPTNRRDSVDENNQQMFAGKDQTWYGQTIEDQLNSSIKGSDFLQKSNNRGNAIRRPTVNNNASLLSSKQDVNEFDATINPDLHKEEHLLKSGRRGTNLRRVTNGTTEPKRNMKVQTQEQNTEENKDLIQVKPALSRTLSYADNGFVGAEDDNKNNLTNNVLDTSKQMRKTFTKLGESSVADKSRVEKYRVGSPTERMARSNSKAEMGPKIRMTSMGSKTGFEVKLGKVAKNDKCDHHEA